MANGSQSPSTNGGARENEAARWRARPPRLVGEAIRRRFTDPKTGQRSRAWVLAVGKRSGRFPEHEHFLDIAEAGSPIVLARDLGCRSAGQAAPVPAEARGIAPVPFRLRTEVERTAWPQRAAAGDGQRIPVDARLRRPGSARRFEAEPR